MKEIHLISHVTYHQLRPDLRYQLVETALGDPTLLISVTPPDSDTPKGWQPYYESVEDLHQLEDLMVQTDTIHATRISTSDAVFTDPEFPVPHEFVNIALEKAALNPRQTVKLIWENGTSTDEVTFSPNAWRRTQGLEGIEKIAMLAKTAQSIVITTEPPQAA